MGNLSKFHFLEAQYGRRIAIIFFVFSFEFNQGIEIYKFGATGWPRAYFDACAGCYSAIFFTKEHTAPARKKAVLA